MHSWEDFVFGRRPSDAIGPGLEGVVSITKSKRKVNPRAYKVPPLHYSRDRHALLLCGVSDALSRHHGIIRWHAIPGPAAVSAGPAARTSAGRLVRHAHMARGLGHRSK